jgi:hypothetical protein
MEERPDKEVLSSVMVFQGPLVGVGSLYHRMISDGLPRGCLDVEGDSSLTHELVACFVTVAVCIVGEHRHQPSDAPPRVNIVFVRDAWSHVG